MPAYSELPSSADDDSNYRLLLNQHSSSQQSSSVERKNEKTTDDYVFQFYVGSLTVVGLFILFRFIQKT